MQHLSRWQPTYKTGLQYLKDLHEPGKSDSQLYHVVVDKPQFLTGCGQKLQYLPRVSQQYSTLLPLEQVIQENEKDRTWDKSQSFMTPQKWHTSSSIVCYWPQGITLVQCGRGLHKGMKGQNNQGNLWEANYHILLLTKGMACNKHFSYFVSLKIIS
jgi:hypothetical protein